MGDILTEHIPICAACKKGLEFMEDLACASYHLPDGIPVEILHHENGCAFFEQDPEAPKMKADETRLKAGPRIKKRAYSRGR